MKLAVITDVHANLPALQAALRAIKQEGYDLLVHTGDVIAIGPFPAESLDLLLNTPNTRFVIGNHDDWFANGLPQPQPPWMSDGEVAHQQWTHAQIDPSLQAVVAQWPFMLNLEFEGVQTTFVHYWLDSSSRNFGRFINQPTATDLDQVFAEPPSRLFFYGHNHQFWDVTGLARYVNPGSLGCFERPVARYTIGEFMNGQFHIVHQQVHYLDDVLFRTFEERIVPEREFIYRAFFGGRFR